MHCSVSAASRILCGNGSYKLAKNIQVGDGVLDAYGKIQRVKCVSIHTPKDNQNCTSGIIRVTTYPVALNVTLMNTQIMSTESDVEWQSPMHIQRVANVTATNDIVWSLPNEIELIPHKHNILTKVIVPSYELGYIIGAYIASGFTTRDHMAIGFHCDMSAESLKHQTTLMTLVRYLDSDARIYVSRHQTMQSIRVYSSMLVDLLYPISERKLSSLYECMLCTNKEYVMGLYEGILHSKKAFMNLDMYELISWCHSELYKGLISRESIVIQNEMSHMVQNHEIIDITTTSKWTTLVANNIPIRTIATV